MRDPNDGSVLVVDFNIQRVVVRRIHTPGNDGRVVSDVFIQSSNGCEPCKFMMLDHDTFILRECIDDAVTFIRSGRLRPVQTPMTRIELEVYSTKYIQHIVGCPEPTPLRSMISMLSVAYGSVAVVSMGDLQFGTIQHDGKGQSHACSCNIRIILQWSDISLYVVCLHVGLFVVGLSTFSTRSPRQAINVKDGRFADGAGLDPTMMTEIVSLEQGALLTFDHSCIRIIYDSTYKPAGGLKVLNSKPSQLQQLHLHLLVH